MEAMVELPAVVATGMTKSTVVKDQIAGWLSETAGSDEVAVRAASLHLEGAQTAPKFLLCLLELAAGGREKGVRVTAATYLKNLVKMHWSSEGAIGEEEKREFRNQLVDVLLRVDGLVLRLLAEAFRIITLHDFATQRTWSELVPALKVAVEKVAVEKNNVGDNADTIDEKMKAEEEMGGEEKTGDEEGGVEEDNMKRSGEPPVSDLKTLNCLLGLQTVVKPFQYFLNPTMAREPVPEPLEMIAKELLIPLQGLFHQLVLQVATPKAEGSSQDDTILLAFCKVMDLALKSHMPRALLKSIDQWFMDLLSLLSSVSLETKLDTSVQEPRLKIWKRALQICCNLVSRHRLHVNRFLPSLTDAALAVAGQSVNAKNLNQLHQHVISLGFDLVSNILETDVGWKLISPHFPSLLDKAIFPALVINDKDHVDWLEEEDEYVQKNLPSSMDEANGWSEDLFTLRQSALNLLGIMALTKNVQAAPPARRRKRAVSTKRRKVSSKAKEKEVADRAGDLLVMPYLNQFPVPADGADLKSDEVRKYYGVMIAYGGLQPYLKTQPAAKVALLLERRVFPLYLMVAPSPYVLANANWMLGQLAHCLPEELSDIVYTALLKALVAPNAGSISWWPVRASAAAALASLLQDGYKPVQWLPLLQATVAGVRMHEDREASMALQMLATVAETGRECVAPHVPAITSVVHMETCKRLPPSHSEPWPQVVELGFAAMAALAKAWQSAEPDEEERGKLFLKWKLGCTAVATSFAELLHQAWLLPLQSACALIEWMEEGGIPVQPAPSCLSDASLLLAAILRCGQTAAEVEQMRLESLIQVWANLVQDWSAWGDGEVDSVFDCIDELINLQERCSVIQFSVTEGGLGGAGNTPPLQQQVEEQSGAGRETTSTTPPRSPPLPILSCVVSFLASAVEWAYSGACWRACRNIHSLLHATQFAASAASDGEAAMAWLVPRFCEAAAHRLQRCSSMNVPLAKPLLLVIAVCFISFPEQVEGILCVGDDGDGDGEGGDSSATPVCSLLIFAEALASLAESEADPGLSLESELKIAVIGLEKVIGHIINKELLQNQKAFAAAHHCLRSLLESMVDLKDSMDSSESDRSGSSSDSQCDSGSSQDDDGSMNDTQSDGSDEEESDGARGAAHEETEEEFLERYAQTARDLQDEACEEAENGQHEDGHDLALGVMGLVDIEKEVLMFLKEHGRKLSSKQPLSRILLARFRDQYPKARGFL